ncbi:MAG: glucokinase [Vicinamibacterales bacterium]
MILAGDIGGTNSRLGLFTTGGDRPAPHHLREFRTADYTTLTDVVAAFLADAPVDATGVRGASFGVAGPVVGERAALTNITFAIDAVDVRERCGVPRVSLLNDLAAMAWSVGVLRPEELCELQAGTALPNGNRALIAAGTGLGQSVLHNVDGRFLPVPSEAGHADWAARTETDITVLRALTATLGRVEVEQVISGMGLRNLHRVLHEDSACAADIDSDAPDAAAALTRSALERRCSSCVAALNLFVDGYGAETGNLALRCVATGGVFVGGGIAPKILPALTDGRFMRAFKDKGPMRSLVEQMPVHVILNGDAGLLGAAVHADASLTR